VIAKNNFKHPNFIPKLRTYLVVSLNLKSTNPYLPNENNEDKKKSIIINTLLIIFMHVLLLEYLKNMPYWLPRQTFRTSYLDNTNTNHPHVYNIYLPSNQILNQQIYTYLTDLHSNHGRMLDTPPPSNFTKGVGKRHAMPCMILL
jgi:hypothetical protein